MGTFSETATGLQDVSGGVGRRLASAPPERTWIDLMMAWLERGRQRRHLRRLDDHMLKDIGLSRADVAMETDKPFWRG